MNVNYNCYCNKCFLINEKILYILPCNHIVHETCFNKYLLENQYNILKHELSVKKEKPKTNCPICKTNIKQIITEKKINSKSKYSQYRINLRSIRLKNSGSINYISLPFGILNVNTFINKLILSKNKSDILNAVEVFIRGCNLKINIIDNTKLNPIFIKNNRIVWKNEIDNKTKCVIIPNHSHYADSFILFYLFRCGFIASDTINATSIGKIIADKCDLLLFKRGVDTNVVNKIKDYLKERDKIIIFPEGTIANNDTLLQFRTGAFYVDVPVCPIILKWRNYVYDDDLKTLLFKFITQTEILIDIYVNDFFYPPFDDKKIDEIRDYMASIGKLEKSQVSNKSMKTTE